MRNRVILFVLVVAFILLSSTLLTTFAQVDDGAIPPLVNLGRESDDPAIDLSSAEMDDLEDVPLFVVTGIPFYDHLMLRSYDTYQDGAWTAIDDYIPYGGESVSDIDDGIYRSAVVIDPRAEISGNLPVPPTVDRVNPRDPMNLDVSYNMGTFRTEDVLKTNYTVEFARYTPDAEQLRDAQAGDESLFLQLPETLSSELIALVDSVTQGSAYDRAVDLVGYLINNMDLNETVTPEGEDPVEHAVLVSGEGDAITITSAFVLMARTTGIPSRLCLGFQVNETKVYQTVRGSDLTVFAQIQLDGIGWVRMDPVTIMVRSLNPDDFLYSGGNATLRGTLTLRDHNVQVFLPEGGFAVLTDDDGGMWLEHANNDGVFEFSNMRAGNYTLGIGTPFRIDTLGSRFNQQVLLGGLNEVTVECRSIETSNVDAEISVQTPSEAILNGEPFLATGWVNTTNGAVQGGTVQAYMASGNDFIPCGLGLIDDGAFQFSCLFEGEPSDYILVVRLMQDEVYGPATAWTSVNVIDETELRVLAPIRGLPGSIANVVVMLVRASTGTGVSGAEINFNDNITLITDSSGSADVQVTLPLEGDHHSVFNYLGDQYLTGSEAQLEIDTVLPELEAAEALLVRNGTGYVSGVINSSKGALDLERVWIDVDSDRSSTLTDDDGMFYIEVNDTRLLLGEALVGVEAMGVSWQVEAMVKAPTKMSVVINGTSAKAVLSDDLGAPLAFTVIEIQREQLSESATTDANGSVTVTDLDPGITRMVYAGDATHLPTSTTVDLITTVEGADPLSLLLPVGLLLAPLILVSLLLYRWRSSGDTEVQERETRVSGPYLLGFPEIDGDLPPVWGVEEELLIQIPSDASVSVLLDEKPLPQEALVGEGGLAKLRLQEGWHVLEAVGPEGRSMESIEIVDYREKVIELFNGNLIFWDDIYGPRSPGSTPREAVRALGNKGGEVMDAALCWFEEAEYSDHPIHRRHFVSMFRALEEVNP